MTTTLRWSVCGQESEITQPLVNRFRELTFHNAKVEVHSIPWTEYKQELTQMAIYRSDSLDVSQAGAPVVNDLLAMDVLRPFTGRELTELGGEESFVPIAWKVCTRILEETVWSIPMFVDPRAIIYWSDLLEKAGVEEETAFSSFENMEETFQRLQASGVQTPWILNIADSFVSLQTACSWLWACGVDIVSEENQKAQFVDPRAIHGFKNFFGLKKYLHPDSKWVNWNQFMDLFLQRRAAVTMFNLGAARTWYEAAPDELRPYLRVAQPPGPSFVGGSSLVIWHHTLADELAFHLVKFLLSEEVQRSYPLAYGQFTVRKDVLKKWYMKDHIFSGFAKCLENGKICPSVKLGGLLEEQLVKAFERVWRVLFADPDADIETTILRTLVPVARRYNMMLE